MASEQYFIDERKQGNPGWRSPQQTASSALAGEDDNFYYFAYGSCMCPVDLRRSLGEPTYAYVVGPAVLHGYRLGFFRRSQQRNCGVLDIVADVNAHVQGVLYRLPWRLSDRLDEREEGYCHETVAVQWDERLIHGVRTYTVIDKTTEEHAPNDWYFSIVMRGAVTCGLPESYCWRLFHHMHHLQQSGQGAIWTDRFFPGLM